MNGPIGDISYCHNVTLVTLPAVPRESRIIAEILETIAYNGINVDMISQTASMGGMVSVSFTIPDSLMSALLTVINALKAKYPKLKCEVTSGMSKITYFDSAMVHTPGVAAKVFSALAEANIQIMMITTSSVDISILVADHDLDEALSRSEKAFLVTPVEVLFE